MRRHSKTGKGVKKICVFCEQEFKVYPCYKDRIHTCSKECSKKMREEKSRIISPNEPKICSKCGERKEAKSFRFDKRFASGRNSQCKKCKSEFWKPEYGKKSRCKQKDEFIRMYGGKCNCCGDTRPFTLTIDHIIPTGNSRNYKRDYGRAVKEYLPRVYQILCASCNLNKSSGTDCGCGTAVISIPKFFYEDEVREG